MKGIFKKVIKYTALIVTGTALFLGGMAGCSSPPQTYVLPESKSIILPPPQSGSPLDYSVLDNVGFIAGKLASRDCYHVESSNKVTAKAIFGIEAEQNVVGSKDYSDGILISETISIGGAFAPSKAMQRYFGDGNILMRKAASDESSDWNGLDTEWAVNDLEIFSEQEYEEKFGLPANEFSDFVINKETINSDSRLKKADDKYILEITLNTELAPAYYVKQMKTMGELDSYPIFESIKMTITFDDTWTVFSVNTEEKYTSKKKILGFTATAECTGGTSITYSYDKADVDVSAYEEYFQQYEKNI